ncbi:LysR substrate-binding domain-containing protein [Paludibacterium paludis]|uniref:LysR family transcriptional regulator n=1 Tax=Paludibacterium paludis TaxID=1225769 RepID=A0A918U919_9NEIS|nr:LysR substrate-binding domain-containing protein [Paludibacterium paludis]GGY12147.1 LysR family transcriptional regulator [Paludibacterium paludis]
MKLPPLNALRVFLVVAEELSFTRAARRLFLTQGAVSRQILGLEAFYGATLFVRQARGLSLTVEGQALLGPVRDAFTLIREASDALRVRQGDIRVRAAATPAMRWVLPNLPDFQTRFPDYTVHLETLLGDGMPFDRSRIDLAIQGVREGEQHPGMVLETISQELLVPVCAPGLLIGRPPLREPDDLRHYPLLHPWRGQDSWAQWLSLAGATRVKSESGLTFDALEFALYAATRGMGVALAQLSMIEEDVRLGRLMVPFPVILETEWSYCLMYPEESANLPKIRTFRDWLMETLALSGVTRVTR